MISVNDILLNDVSNEGYKISKELDIVSKSIE